MRDSVSAALGGGHRAANCVAWRPAHRHAVAAGPRPARTRIGARWSRCAAQRSTWLARPVPLLLRTKTCTDARRPGARHPRPPRQGGRSLAQATRRADEQRRAPRRRPRWRRRRCRRRGRVEGQRRAVGAHRASPPGLPALARRDAEHRGDQRVCAAGSRALQAPPLSAASMSLRGAMSASSIGPARRPRGLVLHQHGGCDHMPQHLALAHRHRGFRAGRVDQARRGRRPAPAPCRRRSGPSAPCRRVRWCSLQASAR